MASKPRVKSINEDSMLRQVLQRKHGPLPPKSLLVYKTAKCRKHKRHIGYICTLTLPLTHPDQSFQGKRCDNKLDAEKSAASECLRFIVDDTELATTNTFDWKSHLNILLMQRLNQSDVTGSDNINYQVLKLDDNSVVLYMAKLSLPRLLPGLAYFGDLSRSKKQAEQSVAEKLASDPKAMNRVLLACHDLNNIDGGVEVARREANKLKRQEKYKQIRSGRAVKGRNQHTGYSRQQHQQHQQHQLPSLVHITKPVLPAVPRVVVIPPEGQSRYRYREEHLHWKDLVASDKLPRPTQLSAYHMSLQRNLIMVFPRGFGRSFVASMVMHRMLLSTAFGSNTTACSTASTATFGPSSRSSAGGTLERRTSYAVMVVADARAAYLQRDKLALDTGLRVLGVGTYSDAVHMCHQAVAGAFDLLVISGDLLLHHLQLGACAALQVQSMCILVFYECIHHHFIAKIMHVVKCHVVKPRILAVTSSPAVMPGPSSASRYATSELQIAAQVHALQWQLIDPALHMPVLPPPVVNIEYILLGKALPPAQPPLPPPQPKGVRPPKPPARPPLPPTVLPLGKAGLVRMALMDSIAVFSSDDDDGEEEVDEADVHQKPLAAVEGKQCDADIVGQPQENAEGEAHVEPAAEMSAAVKSDAEESAVVGDLPESSCQQVPLAEGGCEPSQPAADSSAEVGGGKSERCVEAEEATPLQQLTAFLTQTAAERALGNMLIYVQDLPAATAVLESLQRQLPELECTVLSSPYDELKSEDVPLTAATPGQVEATAQFYGDIDIDDVECGTGQQEDTAGEYYGEIDIDIDNLVFDRRDDAEELAEVAAAQDDADLSLGEEGTSGDESDGGSDTASECQSGASLQGPPTELVDPIDLVGQQENDAEDEAVEDAISEEEELELLKIPNPLSFLGAAPWDLGDGTAGDEAQAEGEGNTAMEKFFQHAHSKVAICTESALCDGQLEGLAHVHLSLVIRLGGDLSYLPMLQNLCGLLKAAVHLTHRTRYVAILSAAEQRQAEVRDRDNAVVRKLFAVN